MDRDYNYTKYGIDEENPDIQGEEGLLPDSFQGIYPLENIKVDRDFYSVFELKRKYDRTVKQKEGKDSYSRQDLRSQIILDSDFQRESVWSTKQKSELIESVLMGLPLPSMYLYEDKYANLIVVDGRQRLTAFFEYLNDKFALSDLNILQDVSKKKFSDLPPLYQSKLEDFQVIAQVIKPPTPDAIIFQIFDRVNRGGTPLNNQEMRNALYQGNATILLKKLSESKAFLNATSNSLKSKRMKDKYIILRALAFNIWDRTKLNYTNDIDDFLGKTMEYINELQVEEINLIEKEFIKCMENTANILGEEAFRLKKSKDGKRSPINMNVFEAVVYMMTRLVDYTNRSDQIKKLYNKLIQDPDFLENIGNYRDAYNKVIERFEMVDKIIEEVMSDD